MELNFMILRSLTFIIAKEAMVLPSAILVLLISSSTLIVTAVTHNILRIAGGENTTIYKYPHSLFLKLDCGVYPRCGGSVLTQDILLTAATCFVNCKEPLNTKVMEVSMGDDYEEFGQIRKIVDFVVHEKHTGAKLANDIALGKVDIPMRLGDNVRRIILMKSPPYEPAFVAGWGSISAYEEPSKYLKHMPQHFVNIDECHKAFGPNRIADGTFCMENENSRPFEGDSGAALVVNDYIQIGIVSWGDMKKSYGKIIYTNISYHFDWISDNAKKLYCKRF
ncbi:hypodermin-B-like [Leguminivora glycinivorella]|uniref:hypodermin-B-like n=1 Tax=Leguminivora glycinivorella TaxID=1035111 RepID=UPI00200C7D02|nr:hypodermin-B-like [Leguminivora glycinivorella]